VGAIVCRAGRTDLMNPDELRFVEPPVLFLVGSLDTDVLAINRRTAARLRCEHQTLVIDGASHLFEEPGALELVADQAKAWFLSHGVPAALGTRYVHGATEREVRQREDGYGHYDHVVDGPAFRDRADAGHALARSLARHKSERPIVLGVPRGGVPVAYEVAKELHAPLDVIVARKLGAPGQEELGIGAVTPEGTRHLNTLLIKQLGVSEGYLERVTAEQCAEARRRERLFRRGAPPLELKGRTVLVIDDGLATGATMHAVIKQLHDEHAGKVVVGVPVGSREACAELRDEVDELVCLHAPESLFAVGAHYERFEQTSDTEVQELLARRR
jgi:predicted phosphoribosyltransferase